MHEPRVGIIMNYVAFIRAINVAGHAIVRMSDVRDAFIAAGCKNVRTYIQSGNVIFQLPQEDATTLFQRVRVKLRDLHGDEPGICFRTAGELERIVRGAPFKRFKAESHLKLYVTFLLRRPRSKPRFPLRSSQEALEAVAMNNLEVFIVSRRKKSGFYGFPNNFIEKELGVAATSRNLSTLTKIVELAQTEPDG